MTKFYETSDVFEYTPESLLEEYFGVVRYHVDRLAARIPRSVETGDLVNAGVVGLLEGAARFDPNRDIDFKTFISYRVNGAIIDSLRSNDWLPRSLRGAASEFQKVMLLLEGRFGRPAQEEEIAAELGLSLEEYRKRLQQVQQMSLVYFDDLPSFAEEEADSVLDMVACDSSQEPEHRTGLVEFVGLLAEAVTRLPAKERIILTLYYYEEFTMKEVALIMNLTESRVSQIHSQLVLRLRALMHLDDD